MTIVLGILSVFCVLACHWLGLLLIRGLFQSSLARLGQKGEWGEDASLALTVLSLVVWLFIDVAVCAAILLSQAEGIGFSGAFVFAIASFTTIGSNAPDNSPLWQLAGPLIAMCGIFIFGWTTSFLVECSHSVREVRKRPDRGTR